jgi:hypothetical protein
MEGTPKQLPGGVQFTAAAFIHLSGRWRFAPAKYHPPGTDNSYILT